MKRSQSIGGASLPVIKIGGLYRAGAGVLVTPVDHEIVGGKRTGRVLVMAQGPSNGLVRWYCPASELVEADEIALGEAGDGRGGAP